MKITYDTATGTFAFDDSAVRAGGANIEARLSRHGQTIRFEGLQFGITIAVNGTETETQSFPPAGVSYRSTDQDLLASVPVRWRPDDAVTVEVWMTNAGITRTAQHSLIVPPPAQPYPSWSWDGAKWAAPVPYPDDGGTYDWDEAAQAWVEP